MPRWRSPALHRRVGAAAAEGVAMVAEGVAMVAEGVVLDIMAMVAEGAVVVGDGQPAVPGARGEGEEVTITYPSQPSSAWQRSTVWQQTAWQPFQPSSTACQQTAGQPFQPSSTAWQRWQAADARYRYTTAAAAAAARRLLPMPRV